MNWAFRSLLTAILIIIPASISFGNENGKDKWLGKDKFQHYFISAFYSGGLAVTANKHFEMERGNSLVFGASVTFSLGISKEIYDSSRPDETSSLKDLAWDLAGVLTGALIAGLTL